MVCVAVRPTSVENPVSRGPSKLRIALERLAIALAVLLALGGSAGAQTATTTSLSISNSSVSTGTEVVLTATVTAGGSNLTVPGTVKFCDGAYSAVHCQDIHVIGTSQLVTTTTNVKGVTTGYTVGQAYYRFFPSAGTHSYFAVFTGTTGAGGYSSSTSSTAPLTVLSTASALPTTTGAITVGGGNTAYTFTASVSGSAATTGVAPSGTISILNASNPATPVTNNIVTTATLVPAPSLNTYSQGAFAANSTASGGPYQIVTGDFNNDGIPDIAFTQEFGTGIEVFLGNGNGGFGAGTTYTGFPSGTKPYGIAMGDFNGDGYVDLVVTNYASGGKVSILLNNGDGTFATPVSYAAGNNPQSVVVGDFNEDGVLDLAVTDNGGNAVAILSGNANGTFNALTSYTGFSAPYAIAVADFNQDGFPDLVVTNYATSTTATIQVLLNNSATPGTFTPQTAIPAYQGTTIAGSSRNISVADFNNDGYPDVAIVTIQNSSNLANAEIFLNNGSGTLGSLTGYVASNNVTGATVADVNGDGQPDVVFMNASGNMFYLPGNGTGGLGAKVALSTDSGTVPTFFALADLNKDGILDVVTTDLGTSTTAGTTFSTALGNQTRVATATSSPTVSVTGQGSTGLYHPNLEAYYQGDSHYNTSTGAVSVIADSDQLSTATTVTSNPAGGGTSSQMVTFTATVSPYTSQNYGTDGDIVTFKDTTNAVTLGTGTLTSGVATLTVSGSTLKPASSNNITAAFVDTVNYTATYPTVPVFGSSTSPGYSYRVGTPPTTSFNIATHYTYDAPFSVTLTSNSTGAITYSLVSGPATVSPSGLVTLTNATGTVTVQATQAASASYIGVTQTASFSVLSGSVWVGNSGASSLSAFDLAGTAISTASGFTGGGLGTVVGPLGMAFDNAGYVWVVNSGSTGISKFAPTGVAVSATPYTGGGISAPTSLAIDGLGQVWIANANNSVSVLGNTGTALTPATGYTAGGAIAAPVALGIDISGSVWLANAGDNSLTQIIGVAAPVAPPATSLTNGTTGARP